MKPVRPITLDLSPYRHRVERFDPVKMNGRVTQMIGLVIEATGPAAACGEICEVRFSRTQPPLQAEVVGVRDTAEGPRVLLMPLGDMEGVRPGSEVVGTGGALSVGVGDALLGRVLDGLGRPIDGEGPVETRTRYPVHATPPDPLTRRRITEPLPLGVRALDGLLTCGRGQRMGIFAGSGVGKSTLMGMIARNTHAQVNVIALVGERGREVREFIENDLGPEGLARSVVVVATSDQPALVRLKAALVATAVAEYFRDQNKDVLLMMDSVTRLAMAQRDIGLATGEPPTTRGYTPSVFALLPKVLERGGAGEHGTITALYTVLVDGDDMNEPIADAARGILDGHVVLSRHLATRNHYPAIDVLSSVSRVMPMITTEAHRGAAGALRQTLATYQEAEDLINVGAYQTGTNPAIDQARALIEPARAFLRQGTHEPAPLDETLRRLQGVFAGAQSSSG
uniref:Flagellum-specific ATP synthase FliI n=1 Tax=uncultured Armatimonadetes bacterium TaxID=157466 RepID=A0A6J4K2I3_9BACT|nr:Flagellum-specific ATP synthase FliI [uncultured Armatimonadetes bacterium]